MPDLAALRAIAVELAQAAGEVLRQRPVDLGVETKSSPTDTVTVMDKAAERVIVDGLTRLRPGDHVIAEESGDSHATSEVTWLVDPLDGTVNYLYRLAPYAVSIAAAVAGEPVVGAVLDVARDELYVGVAGQGSTCNGERLRCTEQTQPAMALVGTGFGYDAEFRAAQANVVRQVLPLVRDIRRAGAAAVDVCSVAAGRLDGFFEAGTHPWDWAAGAVIAREAGAQVGGLRGQPPNRAMVLVANPTLFEALHDLLIAAGAGNLRPPS